MNPLAVSNLANGPVSDLIQWLQAERPLRCMPFNRPMDLSDRNQGHVDGYIRLVHSPNFLQYIVHSVGRISVIVYEVDNLFRSIHTGKVY